MLVRGTFVPPKAGQARRVDLLIEACLCILCDCTCRRGGSYIIENIQHLFAQWSTGAPRLPALCWRITDRRGSHCSTGAHSLQLLYLLKDELIDATL
jgi:hypothetical protein